MNILISTINVLMETVGFVLTIGWIICTMMCLSSYQWFCLSIGTKLVRRHLILLIILFLCRPFSCDLHTKFILLWSEYIVLQSKWFLMLYSLTAWIYYAFSSKAMPTSSAPVGGCTLSCCWTKWCDQCSVVGGQGSSPLDTYLGWWYCNGRDVGPPSPSSSLWSLMWAKNCWSSPSLKSSMFFSWNRIMGYLLAMRCSFRFDVCVCGCCKGDVKYCDEGWFCWSNEVCWA